MFYIKFVQRSSANCKSWRNHVTSSESIRIQVRIDSNYAELTKSRSTEISVRFLAFLPFKVPPLPVVVPPPYLVPRLAPVKKGFSRGSGEVCLCTNSYVRCAHRPAGLCTPTCSAHRPAQHTDPLCMQIFTAHQPACLLLSFRSKLPKFSFYVLRFAHPNVSKVLLKI